MKLSSQIGQVKNINGFISTFIDSITSKIHRKRDSLADVTISEERN